MVEWFFDYSTWRQCIVFLSLLVVLFEGSLFEWERLFTGKTLWLGGNFPGANFPQRQLSGGQFSSGTIILGVNFPGGNYLGAIIQGTVMREDIIWGAIFLGGNCPRTELFHIQSCNIFDFEESGFFWRQTKYVKVGQNQIYCNSEYEIIHWQRKSCGFRMFEILHFELFLYLK